MLFLESMYNLFGTKWLKVYCVPMWAFEPVMQTAAAEHSTAIDFQQRPMNVCIQCLYDNIHSYYSF